MNHSEKIRVAVLYGGRSTEHEVSLQSAKNVIQYLDRSRFEVIPIGIDKQGNWFIGNEVFRKSLADNTVPLLSDEMETWFTPSWVFNTNEPRQALSKMITEHRKGPLFDVVFPLIHGISGEDGSLQGLLELAEIPYVGCGLLSSAIGMDKDIAKRLASSANIPVAPYLVLKNREWQKNKKKFLEKIAQELPLPLFIKPANTGSSVGITKVKKSEYLTKAIDEAFNFDTKVLVEQGLDMIELEVAVLESLNDQDPIVSVVGEIRSRHEFYSYEAKYIDSEGAQLLIPAKLSQGLCQEAQEVAKKLFIQLECEGMARIDLFYDKIGKQIVFNEVNTIPGFTQISMYPKLMAASGIAYTDLLTHLIELALKRQQNKNKLIRNYT